MEVVQCDLETKLQKAPIKLSKWFHNDMKANQDKFHFLSSFAITTMCLLLACILENLGSPKLFGVTIDGKLNFTKHVTKLCDKTSRKIQPLARISP